MPEFTPPSAPTAPVDADALRARVEQSRARVALAQTRAVEAKAALEGRTTSATSPDHAVTVTVNAAGTLVDLSFAQSAGKLPLPSLARSVLTTYRRATAGAVAETEALLGDLLGFDAPVLDIVRASAPDPRSGGETMTGYAINPDGLDQHAAAVDALGRTVGDGAAAEVIGTAQANFGVLIGNTLGYGITALSDHFAAGLKAAATALDATATQLHNTASGYRQAEEATHQHVTGLGKAI